MAASHRERARAVNHPRHRSRSRDTNAKARVNRSLKMGTMRTTLPVYPLDLEPFRTGGAAERREVARQVDVACRDTGFLLVTGHGVPQETCDAALDAFGAFFDLPEADKRAVVVEDPAANRGYSALGQEGLSYSRGQKSPRDLFEAFNVGSEDTDGDYYDRHRSFFAPNRWPARPAHLRDTWRSYDAAVTEVADTVLAAMALALALPEQWFVERCAHAIVTTRAINYERRVDTPDPVEGQMRMGAHTDYGVLTVLLADDVGGLQVFRDGVWHEVPTPRGAFVCNLGDMLARWTNDRWISTLHRVVPPPVDSTGTARRRSIARFLDCPPDLLVETISSCIDDEHPPRYEPVNAGEWLRAKVLGSRALQLPELDDTAVSGAP
jgi:isopenicillin N synthase-like dioxygenase